jgi:hypothetical protein
LKRGVKEKTMTFSFLYFFAKLAGFVLRAMTNDSNYSTKTSHVTQNR